MGRTTVSETSHLGSILVKSEVFVNLIAIFRGFPKIDFLAAMPELY